MSADPLRKHWDQVETILRANAMHLIAIRVALAEEDMKQATDLVVTVKGGTVSVRLRALAYLTDEGRNDLTIRSFNRGYRTEIDKIRAGFAHWYLYGWEDAEAVREWVLADIDTIRTLELWTGWPEIPNRDGQTRFIPVPFWFLRLAGAVVSCSDRGIVPGNVWRLGAVNRARLARNLSVVGAASVVAPEATRLIGTVPGAVDISRAPGETQDPDRCPVCGERYLRNLRCPCFRCKYDRRAVA